MRALGASQTHQRSAVHGGIQKEDVSSMGGIFATIELQVNPEQTLGMDLDYLPDFR